MQHGFDGVPQVLQDIVAGASMALGRDGGPGRWLELEFLKQKLGHLR